MKQHLPCLSLLLAACAALNLHAAETKTDWCTLVTPDKAEMDKPFDVTVTFKKSMIRVIPPTEPIEVVR